VAELLPEFSFSEYVIDDRLSRFRWIPPIDEEADDQIVSRTRNVRGEMEDVSNLLI
jgi:hypothetical protein